MPRLDTIRRMALLAITAVSAALLAYFWGVLCDDRQQLMRQSVLTQKEVPSLEQAQIESILKLRATNYENTLRGLKGFIDGSQQVHPSEWQAYTKAADLMKADPAIRAIGIVMKNVDTRGYLVKRDKVLESILHGSADIFVTSTPQTSVVEQVAPQNRRFLIWQIPLEPRQLKRLDLPSENPETTDARLIVAVDTTSLLKSMTAQLASLSELSYSNATEKAVNKAVFKLGTLEWPLQWRSQITNNVTAVEKPSRWTAAFPAKLSKDPLWTGYILLFILVVAGLSFASNTKAGKPTMAVGDLAATSPNAPPAPQTTLMSETPNELLHAEDISSLSNSAVLPPLPLETTTMASFPESHTELSQVITLPAQAITEVQMSEPVTEPITRENKSKDEALDILLVDDTFANQQYLSLYLRKLGHHVTIASDGIEAVDACAATIFDVVLMDIQMPRMDGLTAARLIREQETASNRRPSPIIAMTAYSPLGFREKCIKAGMTSHLPKPIELASLRQVLQTLQKMDAPLIQLKSS